MTSLKHEDHDLFDPSILPSREKTTDPIQLPSPEDSSMAHQLPTPNGESGNLDDELLALGARSRQLIKAIQKLETLQIKATLPSLPKFVVVGDQSAGKSSIIEALCDISLPRNEGTCTRCPFQITTTASQQNGNQWRCTVALQLNYHFDPSMHNTTDLEQWHERTPLTVPFATVVDKQNLASLLIRAQQAILNPSANPELYATSPTVPQGIQVEFSPNLVCLDISGPELPDMSFYDLPGTINVHQQQHMVSVVERMVRTYVSDPKALILLACAADQDIETSTTFRFIRACQAEKRCLGVLTKADLVGEHRIERVHHILENTTFPLDLGWHITKQLSSAQLAQGFTHGQARALEKSFFAAPTWTGLPAAQKGRYGISNLQDAISLRLTQHIRDDMPEIIGRVRERLHQLDGELALFGERDANPILTVRDVVRDIADAIMDQIKGRTNRKDFASVLASERLQLRKSLIATMPVLDYATPGYQTPSFAVDLCDDDEPPVTPTPGRRTTATPAPSRKRKAPDTASSSAKRPRAEAPSEDGPKKLAFTLSEIEEIIRANSDNSLMVQASTEVNNILIARFMDNWDELLATTLDHIRDLVLGMIDNVGRQHLNKYHATMLFPEALRSLRHFGEAVIASEFASIRRLLERERYRPSTSAQIRETVENAKRMLTAKRRERRIKEIIDAQEAQLNRSISDAERKKRLADDVLPADPYAASVDAFALPQAYYQIVVPRFNDNVFQHIDFDLLKTIHDQVGNVLMAKLNATNADACARLLMEDPERELLRQQLLAERDRLHVAMSELNDLRSA